jgi:hypothetical protein
MWNQAKLMYDIYRIIYHRLKVFNTLISILINKGK